jgi:hypothetical protein
MNRWFCRVVGYTQCYVVTARSSDEAVAVLRRNWVGLGSQVVVCRIEDALPEDVREALVL